MDDFLKSIGERLHMVDSQAESLMKIFAELGINFTIDREPRIILNQISFTTILLKHKVAFYFDKNEKFISWSII